MTGKGIRLRKLQATGDGKESASVDFRPGLNIVAFMSQTGKTYILQCINFLLGGKTRPKRVKESKGYDTVWLEFEDMSGMVYVLMRTLDATDFRLYNVPLEKIEAGTAFTKQAKSAGSKSSAATLIAGLSGFSPAKLKSNRFNKKANLSFRTMSHFFIVDELMMMDDASPIFSRHVYSPTIEKSAFKFLVTGTDDRGLEEIEEPTEEEIAAVIRRDVLQTMIEQLVVEIEVGHSVTGSVDLSGIEQQLAASSSDIAEMSVLIRQRQEARRSLWADIQSRESRLIALDELLARFQLLRSHYESDLKRLEFIGEGQHFLFQLETVPCPLCGSSVEATDDTREPSGGLKVSDVQTAYAREATKIRSHMADLESTVTVLTGERVELAASAASLREALRTIDDDLSVNLAPRLSAAKEHLQSLVQRRSDSLYVKMLGERLLALKAERDAIADLPEVDPDSPEPDAQVYVDHTATKELCDMMRALLERWHYLPKDVPVEFVHNNFDFLIDGQARGDNGKGVRALIHAAFNVALMRYLLSMNLPHTRFVVLDSPLTTYKERDNEPKPEENDEVRGEVQTGFFEDLAKTQPNEQIIILENKEPPASISGSSHYIKFVGNNSPGRAGFFPAAK